MKSLYSSSRNPIHTTATIAGAILFAFLTHGCSSHHPFSLGPTFASSTANGWEDHRDPAGFEVSLPDGWTAEAPADKPILIHNADNTDFAVVQPFIAQAGETAQDCLRKAPEELAEIFPEAHIADLIQRSQETETTSDQATADVRFSRNGLPMTANLQCSIYKRGAMFYAIAAPADRFDQDRDTLVRILASFQFTQKERASSDQPSLSWQTWRDPREGAFTIEVPQGWKVDGGTVRMSAIDVRTAIRVVSPDGNTTITVGDQNIPTYCLPHPLLEQAGLHEGSTYSTPGAQMVIRTYMPGADFAADEAQRTLPSEDADLQITQTRQRPDVGQKINSLLAPFAQYGTQAQVDVGEVTYTCNCQGRPRQGYCLAGTLRLQEEAGNGIWGVPFLYGYLTTPDKTGEAEGILKHIVQTFQPDADWTARQQQTTMDVSRITTQANNEIMSIWRASTDAQEQSHDRILRRWDNTIRGQETVYDPDTNTTWQVEAGHNYYFARPTATQPEFAGNEAGSLPDMRYHEVVRVP